MTRSRCAHQLHALLACTMLAPACSPDAKSTTEHHARASVVVRPTSDPILLAASLGVPPESLRAAGEERYGRQSYDSARDIWRVELSRAKRVSDTSAEARAHMWLGLAAWRLGEYEEARHEGELSLAMKRRLGMDAELSRSYNALGLLAWNQGRQAEALQHFDSAIRTAKRNHDAAGVARAASNVPLVQIELGDFDGARHGLDTALAAGRAIGDDRTEGNALANLGMLEIRLGNPTRAIPLLSKAREHYAAIEYTPGEANALGQLATAWGELGELQRALATADSSLILARRDRLQQEIAAELEVIADLQEQSGSPRLSLRRLLEADSMDAALGLTVERATNLRRISAVLLELDEVGASVTHARQALAGHLSSDAKGEAVFDRLQLAQSLARAGDPHSSRAEVDSASRDAIRSANPTAHREAAAVAARLALDNHDPRLALTDLDVAERDAPSTDWRLADLRAEAWLALGKLPPARRYEERSVAALEHERSTLGLGPLRSVYLANRTMPFARLIDIYLAQGDTGAAFRVAASIPGRGIAERLSGYSGAALGVAAVAEGERLLMRSGALERQIADLSTEPQTAEQRAALEHALSATRTAFEAQLAQGAPSPDARMLGVAIVDLREVQSHLAKDEALLTYLVAPDHAILFAVRAASVTQRSIPLGRTAIAERIRVLRALLEHGTRSDDMLAALGELHDLLLAPAIESGALDGVSRIRIVPHGPLIALPFSALWNRRTGRFLVEDRVLSYLPSVATLTVESRVEPVSITQGLTVFAPLPDSLPGSAEEAREIGRMVRGARLRIGRASTETAVRAALSENRAIHIASHGAFNSQNPLFSRMAVGSTRADTAANDGILEVHEILGLRTRSALVFLSGCETGLGTDAGPYSMGGEEGSLSQAFLVAGAGSVVSTLWRVGDADATRLATSFYRDLDRGQLPDEALAHTQREAIRTRVAVSTWAAYTVSGASRANSWLTSVKPRSNP